MNERDKSCLERMAMEVDFIERVSAGVPEDRFLADEVMQHAIMMSFITIGECAVKLSDEFKEHQTQIEWGKMVAMRNIAAHGYWQLNMRIVWRSVVENVPEIREFLNRVL